MTVLELKQFLQFFDDDAVVSIRYMVEDTEEIIAEEVKAIGTFGTEKDMVITGVSVEDEAATGVL